MEPEELGDPGGAELVEARVRLREVLEPLEVARVRAGRLGEGLGVRGQAVRAVAGLREELGVLLEDLEVFLWDGGGLGFAGASGCVATHHQRDRIAHEELLGQPHLDPRRAPGGVSVRRRGGLAVEVGGEIGPELGARGLGAGRHHECWHGRRLAGPPALFRLK